jgi:hypothetical protein
MVAGGVTAAELPAPVPAVPQIDGAGVLNAATATITLTPMSTRVALDVPDRTFVGQVVATDTPSPISTPDVQVSGPLAEVMRNWRQGWQWVVLAIVLVMIAILIIAYLRARE